MTEEERYEKLNDKLDRILDKLESKFKGVDEKLSNHEVRIVVLETHDKADKADKSDWKSQIIGLLVKAVAVGAVAVASLAGAGGILAKIYGV